MRRPIGTILLAAMTLACGTADGPLGVDSRTGRPAAAAAQTSTQIIPVEFENLDTSAEACVGEAILFQLREAIVLHETTDAQGRQHFHLTFHDKGTKGVGVTTGTVYHLTGAFIVTENSLPREFTVVFNSKYIGQGQAPSWLIQVVEHVTRNVNGDLTAEVTHVSFKCQG